MHISMHKTSRHTLLLSLTSEQAFRQKWTEIPPGVTRRGGLPLPSVTRAGRVRVTSLNGGHCNLGSSGAPVRPGVRQLKWGCASRLHPLQKNNKTKRTRHHTKILQNLGQSRLLKNTRKKLKKKKNHHHMKQGSGAVNTDWEDICGVHFCFVFSFLTLYVGQGDRKSYSLCVCTAWCFSESKWLLFFVFVICRWFHCERVKNTFVWLRVLGMFLSPHPVQQVQHPLPRCCCCCRCFHHLPQPPGLKPVKICMLFVSMWVRE